MTITLNQEGTIDVIYYIYNIDIFIAKKNLKKSDINL